MSEKVIVLRTSHMREVVEALTSLGLVFVEEQHGSGPVHYACAANGIVFEVYPSKEPGSVKILAE